MSIPFTGFQSIQLRNKIKKLIRQHFPTLEPRILVKPNLRLSNFFRVKDTIPKALQSNVVYKFQCSVCGDRYLGKTSRHFATRIAEHMGVSDRTGAPMALPKFSAIREHSQRTGHLYGSGDFSIVAKAENSSDLAIMETLLIRKSSPKLNARLQSCDICLF